MRGQLLAALALVPALSMSACAEAEESTGTSTSVTTEATTTSTTTTTASSTDAATAETVSSEALLKRLIEEEKVAHDLYLAFDERYDAQVFSNITRGEVGHQDAVLRLLDAAGIEDPRTGTPGEFADPELQTVYDDFLARGLESVTEAYQVGVDFEKWDIEGLENEISAVPEDDTELRDLLQFLLDGSRRHLSAFERQLNRPGLGQGAGPAWDSTSPTTGRG